MLFEWFNTHSDHIHTALYNGVLPFILDKIRDSSSFLWIAVDKQPAVYVHTAPWHSKWINTLLDYNPT